MVIFAEGQDRGVTYAVVIGEDWDDVVTQGCQYWDTLDPSTLRFEITVQPKKRWLRADRKMVAKVSQPAYDVARRARLTNERRAREAAREKAEREKEEQRNQEWEQRRRENEAADAERLKERRSKMPPSRGMTSRDYDQLAQDWGYDSWDRFDDSRP